MRFAPKTTNTAAAAALLALLLAGAGLAPQPFARAKTCLAPALAGKGRMDPKPAVTARPDLDRLLYRALAAPWPYLAEKALYRAVALQGVAVLEAYSAVPTIDGGTAGFLSDFGLEVLAGLRALAENPDADLETFQRFQRLAAFIPTLENPLGRSREGRDVFVDVFPGMTLEQIQALGSPTNDRDPETRLPVKATTLCLQLSGFCSNQCIICAAQHKGRLRSAVRQMPYPLACKMLIRFKDAGLPEGRNALSVTPYDASDVSQYSDAVLGANVINVLDYAVDLGYYRAGAITHGSFHTPDRITRPIGDVLISFNVLYPETETLVRDTTAFRLKNPGVPLPRELVGRESALVARYSDHFHALIQRELRSGQPFSVRMLNPVGNQRQMKFLAEQGCQPAVDFLNEMQAVQCRVLADLKTRNFQLQDRRQTLLKTFDELVEDKRIDFLTSSIAWLGHGVELLSRLGVPAETIRWLQDLPHDRFSSSDGITVLPDGRMVLVRAEENDDVEKPPLLTAEAQFGRLGEPGFRQKEYETFLRVLRMLLEAEYRPAESRNWVFTPSDPGRLGTEIRQNLQACVLLQTRTSPVFADLLAKDAGLARQLTLTFAITPSFYKYNGFLRQYFLAAAEPGLKTLLGAPDLAGDTNVQRRIFDLIRATPFPVYFDMDLHAGADPNHGFLSFRYYPGEGTLLFEPHDAPNHNEKARELIRQTRNPLRPNNEWPLPAFCAFSANPQSRATPLDKAA